MCFDMLWGLWRSPGPKLDEKYAKYANFDSLNPDIQSWASILCWNIFNDYLWSYRIKGACVVACFVFRVTSRTKGCQKCAKYTDFAPSWIPNVQSGPLILCRDIFNDYL